jgi:hypothetical protein
MVNPNGEQILEPRRMCKTAKWLAYEPFALEASSRRLGAATTEMHVTLLKV